VLSLYTSALDDAPESVWPQEQELPQDLLCDAELSAPLDSDRTLSCWRRWLWAESPRDSADSY